MFQKIKQNSWFLTPYLLFLTTIGVILIAFNKKEIHLFINQYNCTTVDFIFKNMTYLGDGIAVAIFIAVLLFIRYRYFLIAIISTFFITGIVQTLKKVIFKDICRPSAYFKNQSDVLHYVDGVDLHSAHSFPSGHTASAFTIFLLIAMFCKNKTIKLLCFIFALLIGFSRVYLSQHFLNDIYFGSLIAVVVSFLCYVWINNWKSSKLDCNILTKNKIQK